MSKGCFRQLRATIPRLAAVAGIAFLMAFTVTALCPLPASAHDRHCNAEIALVPAGHDPVTFFFEMWVNVQYRSQANRGRREARQSIIDCLQTAWDAGTTGFPSGCTAHWRVWQQGWPFDGVMRDELEAAACQAYRDIDGPFTGNVVVTIWGQDGCVNMRGGNLIGNLDPAERVHIATQAPFECAPSIFDARPGRSALPQLTPEAQRVIEEALRDWEDLPGIRLPGYDIGGEWLGMDGTWRDCLALCRDTDGCNAWTYRGPETTPGSDEAGCLLKRRAGERVSDTCCHSGVME